MFSFCPKHPTIPSVFCFQLIILTLLYLIPVVSAVKLAIIFLGFSIKYYTA